MRRPLAFWLLVSWLGCATPKPESVHPQPSAAKPSSPVAAVLAPVPSEPADPRKLPAHATFADLVDAARALDTAGEGRSDAGCLLRGSDAVRLEADLLPGARPLPTVSADLTAAVEQQTGAVSVLSAWGNVKGEPGLILLAFTTTSPAAIKLPVIALFMTHRGVYVRGVDPLVRAQPSAMTADSAATLLTQLSGLAAIYVSAERDTTLTALASLLRAIPNRLEVGLAVALPKDTRLPPPAAANTDLLCPDGLPPPAPNEREGDLDARAAREAIAPLRDAALSCALATGGRALLGGRLVLGLRIGADGKPQHVCFVSDAIAEPQLRRCLVSATRDLSLPTPHPAGFVDLNVPLDIALEGPSPQRVSCD